MNVRCVCGNEMELEPGQTVLCDACGRPAAAPASGGAARLPSPPPRGYAAPSARTPLFIIGMVLALLILLAMGCAGVFALLLFPVLNQRSENLQIVECNSNLRVLGVALAMYAGENKDNYPPLPGTPGRLMFDGDGLYPEYVDDTAVFMCPEQALSPPADPLAAIDDESYFYLSHAVTAEMEGLAYAETCRERLGKGLPVEGDIAVAPGQGSKGGNELMYLRRGVESLLAEDPLDDYAKADLLSEIPLMVEWPFHHDPPGGNVLYLDGHVEFLEYPGTFPMTEAFIKAMQELDTPAPPATP